MSQPTMNTGGTAVAEAPPPILPGAGVDDASVADNRRKLMVVGVALAVLVVAVVGFFLMKSGGSSNDAALSGPVPHHPHHFVTTTPNAPVVKLPKVVNAPTGVDPFKPLFAPPAAAPAGSTVPVAGAGTGTAAAPTGSTPTTSVPTSSAPAASYAPVSIQLVSTSGTKTATFLVVYSNGKVTRSTRFANVPVPTNGLRTDFGNVFALLSIQDGQATVQFGDGSPFDLAPGAGNRHTLG